jgi:hypothetical protein
MPLTPAPTIQEIHDSIGQLSCALFAIHDLAHPCEDADNPQFRIGALVGLLAERLDQVYADLSEYIHATAHPEEVPHV